MSTPLARILAAPKFTAGQRMLLLAIAARADELPLEIAKIARPLGLDIGAAEVDGKVLYRQGHVCPNFYNPSAIVLGTTELAKDALAVAKLGAAKAPKAPARQAATRRESARPTTASNAVAMPPQRKSGEEVSQGTVEAASRAGLEKSTSRTVKK